jgi:uncharacterized protein YggE
MADKKKLNISLDYRILCLILVGILVVLLVWLRPWSGPSGSDRVISVSGEAILKATPDEFVFYPSYEIKNADRQTALNELTKKNDEIIAGLKTAGATDEQIKTSSSDYEKFTYIEPTDGVPTYTLQLTVTVGSKELAQKIQDYLLTTTPSGTISPYAAFSSSKRKELEAQARDEATKDAREKAEQSAKNLGFRLGEVKSIEDQSGFGGIIPLDATLQAEDTTSRSSLSVQPGENEINYSVRVVYYLN